METISARYPYKIAKMEKFPMVAAAAGAITEAEMFFTEDRLISGVVYKGNNTNFGDYVKFEVVHPLAGVVKHFVESWYVSDDSVVLRLHSAKVPAGLGIRVTYYNTGSKHANLAINLELYTES